MVNWKRVSVIVLIFLLIVLVPLYSIKYVKGKNGWGPKWAIRKGVETITNKQVFSNTSVESCRKFNGDLPDDVWFYMKTTNGESAWPEFMIILVKIDDNYWYKILDFSYQLSRELGDLDNTLELEEWDRSHMLDNFKQEHSIWAQFRFAKDKSDLMNIMQKLQFVKWVYKKK
ncbi:MAG: hypothetical protein V1709_04685 [Planctomycetota bacterium]